MADGHRASSGRFFSAAWWRGHWDLRDECGSYSSVDGMGECNRASGHRKLHRQLAAEAAADDKRRAAKNRAQPSRREQLRADTRLGKHAQDLRAENYGMGYKTETAAFYGSDKVAQSDESETRLTAAQADREATRAAEADREEAAAYRAAQKASKPRKLGQAAPADWLHRPLTRK